MSIRVLIVDDSSLARSILRALLEADPEMEIVGEAADGQAAVEMARSLRPQVITMDLKMPVMDGLAAVTEIMSTNPLPILVVSSVADASEACEAIAHGALDAVGKPELDEGDGADFVAKVKLISRIRVILHLRTRPHAAPDRPATAPTRSDAHPAMVFAIASSTGGPQALAQLLGALPADFPGPILVSQHIASGFAPGLAQWLSGCSKLPVQVAVDGDEIRVGQVYLSPSEINLSVSPNQRIHLVPQADSEIYHPSCNVLLAGIARVYGSRSVGIILTGMGGDGCQGLEQIRKAGGTTWAQDEDSSVIFGMNKMAIDAGLIDQVLPLQGIAAAMLRIANSEKATGVA